MYLQSSERTVRSLECRNRSRHSHLKTRRHGLHHLDVLLPQAGHEPQVLYISIAHNRFTVFPREKILVLSLVGLADVMLRLEMAHVVFMNIFYAHCNDQASLVDYQKFEYSFESLEIALGYVHTWRLF